MTMKHIRGQIAERCEAVTRSTLVGIGLDVAEYGQGLLSDAARELLRGVPTAQRWTQDFIIRTPAGHTVLVDAKFSHESENHSIEMRSLLVAGQSDLPTFYVCSRWQIGGVFTDFSVLHYQQIAVVGPSSWPCCHHCREIFTSGTEPMRQLPERCPQQERGTRASGTPYFVIRPPFPDLTPDRFDLTPWFAVDPPGRGWDHNAIVGRPPSAE